MPLFLKYHSSIFFFSLLFALVALLFLKLPLFLIMAIILIPQVFNHIFQYTSFCKLQKEQTFHIFGLTKSAIRKERVMALSLGIGLFVLIYFSNKLKWDGVDSDKTWLFATFIGFKILESFIPFSNWSVIVDKDLIYVKKPFFVGNFKLEPKSSMKKIATDKIELHQNSGCIELKILDEELTIFEQIIHNLNPEINPNSN